MAWPLQAMPPELNGGRYRDASLPGRAPQPAQQAGGTASDRPSSYASLLGLAASRRTHAAPLLDALLAAGACPAGDQAALGAAALPLAEAATAGGVQGAAHLLDWAARHRLPLLRLGWAEAAAAAARRCLASDSHHELLCLLLDAWQAQRDASERPLAAAQCRAILSALLAAHTERQAPRLAAAQASPLACFPCARQLSAQGLLVRSSTDCKPEQRGQH